MDTYQKEVVVEHADGSGTNTVLIVIILLIIVGAGVWWFTSQKGNQGTQGYTPPSDINVDVNLPVGGGTDTGSGTETPTGTSSTSGSVTGGGTIINP